MAYRKIQEMMSMKTRMLFPRIPLLFLATCFSVLLLGFSAAVLAQDPVILYQPDPDSPIGERNPSGPPELAQFDFLIGDWDVDMTWYLDENGPTKSIAEWHNHWVVNGLVVMLEWRGPRFTGTELRQWDKNQGKWVGVNIYPDFGANMPRVTAEKAGDTMQVFIPFEGPDGSYINRETYFDIQSDSYRMKSEISKDNGKTWERGQYEMVVTRKQM
jgi:hypothetical protein